MSSIEPDLQRLGPGQEYIPYLWIGHDVSPRTWVSRLVKRGVDVVGASVLLILLLPVFVLVALAVRLTSRGPVLFRQRRVGQDAQEFLMYKFRSMRLGSDAVQEDLARSRPDRVFLKLERDPRVTPVGALLRKYSLDELPQLLNVLRGEMSLIGPRPLLPSDYAGFPRNGWMRRFAMKPGMTGLWQVSGRSLCSDEERMRLDMEYVDEWSLRLDLEIAMSTPRAVLSARGAY